MRNVEQFLLFFLDSAVSAWCSSNAVIDAVRCRSEKWAEQKMETNKSSEKEAHDSTERERERERENKSQERHQS